MTGNDGEALNLEELALEFLQGTNGNTEESVEYEEETEPQGSSHPAWKPILDAIPAEYHAQVLPTLQDWDTGVSRRFQKIHDEYEPYKRFEDIDPDTLATAADVYQQLLTDPAATMDLIGKAFGLSPESSQSASEEEDFDGLELPDALRARLAKLDDHDRVLGIVTQELLERRQAEEEAEEDEALEEYLEELHEEFGDFDADYVVSLLAVGVDGEEAIARYQQITGQANYVDPTPRAALPKVMSSSGGVPAATGGPDLSKLSSQDTKALVENILRLAAQE